MASSIQLLRSTNAQERPFAGNLLEGQPAININPSEPGLFFKATDGSVVKIGPAAITSDGSPPNSSPTGASGNAAGELWLDKSMDPAVLKVYDGAAWIDAGSGGGGGGGTSSFLRWLYVSPTGGETSLSGTSAGVLLDYTPGLEEVYVNGVLITRGSEYVATNGSSITNLSPLAAGDVVTVICSNPTSVVELPGTVTLLRWTKLASAGESSLSGVDSSGQALVYTSGFEEVYVNGAFLRRGFDYTATDGSEITLTTPLSEDDEVTVLAWTPFTVGELAATNPVNIRDYGVVGNGVANDTAKINAALLDSEDRILDLGSGTYYISGELTIKNTQILHSGAKFVGTGSVRGVIDNEEIPYEIFGVKFNIVRKKDRSDTVVSADFVVDPCLGSDGNTGTAGSPIRSLSQLKVLLAASSLNTATVVLRSGRHEISGSSLDLDKTFSGGVTIKANPGEKPVVSGEMLFAFRNGSTASAPLSKFFQLWAVDSDWSPVPISTSAKVNDRGGYVFNRNTNQAVTAVGNVATIGLDSDLSTAVVNSLNLAFTRLRVTQSWSMSLYTENFTYASNQLSFDKPASASVFYWNGFDAGINNGFAPFIIEGLSQTKGPENWYSDGSAIHLPESGNVFATVAYMNQPLQITGDNYAFEGLTFSYFSPTLAAQVENYTGTPTGATAAVFVTGDNCSFGACNFSDIEGCAVISLGDDFSATDCSFERIGVTAISIGDRDNPTLFPDNSTVSRCSFSQYGNVTASGKAVYAVGDNVTISECLINGGSTHAIFTAATPSIALTYTIERNVVRNCGMTPGGAEDERFKVNDAGAIHNNALGIQFSDCINYTVRNNVICNVTGHKGIHGIYLDNGQDGGTIEKNLVFGIPNFSFYCRNESVSGVGTTGNLTVSYNIFFGTVTLGGINASKPSVWNNNAQICLGALNQDLFGNTVTVTLPFSGRFPQGRAHEDFAEIRELEAFTNAGFDVRSYPVAGFVREVIYPFQRYERSFTPTVTGSTSAGSASYTSRSGFIKVDGQTAWVDIRVVYSGHTGTGRVTFPLAPTGYEGNLNAGQVWPFTVYCPNYNYGTAGVVVGRLQSGENTIQLFICKPDGTLADFPLLSSGELVISGHFRIR